MTRGVRWVLVAAALVAGLVSVAAGHWVWRNRQIADPKFDASVAKPAYPAPGPRVCIDQAHHNFATASGRYRPFAELLRNDGYTVTANQARFTPEALAACDVLVIANALGARWPFLPGAAGPAFTPAEIGQVVAWVEGGGALLLIADHHPAGGAAAGLAQRLGVDMSMGFTYDDPHSDWSSGSPSWLVFQRDTGALLLPHPVTEGRDSSERVKRVVTFTGQSLLGPEGSVGFLALAGGARDRLPSGEDRSAAGRAQAVALTIGDGRVVVAGEAAMLTAQVTDGGRRRFGMSWPGTDGRRLTLNLLHWLSGVLPAR